MAQLRGRAYGAVLPEKILDFGISKFTQIDESNQVTRAGSMLGTLFFMSPEQARSAASVDLRSDLYSVGAMLYLALTGLTFFAIGRLIEPRR